VHETVFVRAGGLESDGVVVVLGAQEVEGFVPEDEGVGRWGRVGEGEETGAGDAPVGAGETFAGGFGGGVVVGAKEGERDARGELLEEIEGAGVVAGFERREEDGGEVFGEGEEADVQGVGGEKGMEGLHGGGEEIGGGGGERVVVENVGHGWDYRGGVQRSKIKSVKGGTSTRLIMLPRCRSHRLSSIWLSLFREGVMRPLRKEGRRSSRRGRGRGCDPRRSRRGRG